MLAEYDHFCRRFGPLPLPGFLELWQEAGALVEAAEEAGVLSALLEA
jgi:hypothetical protein